MYLLFYVVPNLYDILSSVHDILKNVPVFFSFRYDESQRAEMLYGSSFVLEQHEGE